MRVHTVLIASILAIWCLTGPAVLAKGAAGGTEPRPQDKSNASTPTPAETKTPRPLTGSEPLARDVEVPEEPSLRNRTRRISDRRLSNPPKQQERARLEEDEETIQHVMSQREMVLSVMVLTFGVAVLFANLYLVRRKPAEATSFDTLLSLNSVVLVITATLFLITAGYTQKQIGPALGLLGTIVGYILGGRARPKEKGSVSGQQPGVGGNGGEQQR